MTTPVFLATDSTACDDDRPLTAEHGKRAARNALAIANERVGHVSSAFSLVDDSADTRRTLWAWAANWAYLGPWHYYCQQPTGQTNAARPRPYIRLLINGRTLGQGTVGIVGIAESVGDPTTDVMQAWIDDGAPVSESQYDVIEASGEPLEQFQSALLIPIRPGWNRIWLAIKSSADELVAPTSLTGAYTAIYSPAISNLPSHPALYAQAVLSNSFVPRSYVDVKGNLVGETVRYTVPYIQRINSEPNVNDGQWLLWEPTGADLENIRQPIAGTDIYPGSPGASTVIAEVGKLVALVIDGLGVDGSQAFQEEDNQFGGWARYWQLASGTRYSETAQRVASMRRAVCAQIAMFSDTVGDASETEGNSTGNPRQWIRRDVTSVAIDTVREVVITASDPTQVDFPFAQPPSRVTFEVRFSVICFDSAAVVEGSSHRTRFGLQLIGDGTFGVVTTEFFFVDVPILPNGSASTGSALARTAAWSSIGAGSPITGPTAYGQEGMTMRGERGLWQDVQFAFTVNRTEMEVYSYYSLRVRCLDVSFSPARVLLFGPLAVRQVGQ